jgi:hypothetical protein
LGGTGLDGYIASHPGGDFMGTNQPKPDPAMQGEGNRTADRQYREGATRHAQSGKSEDAGKQAKQALESEEGDELAKAERDGKAAKHSAG